MEDLSNNIDFAHSDGSTNRFEGDMAGGPFGLFFSPRELTPAEVLELFTLGETEMGL